MLNKKFQNIYKGKVREGIFVDAQIIELFEERNYNTKLIATECRVW